MKSEGVKDIVEWLEDKCKEAKAEVESCERECNAMGHFGDCGEFYYSELKMARARLKTLVEVKIGAEKYMKKLRHEGQ